MACDLETYKRRSAPVGFDDLDLTVFSNDPLPAPVLRCLSYMHDVEYHTICYLRDLLLTPAHADPDVTAFLSSWAFEEYWHGEAIAAVLSAHGIEAGSGRVASLRASLGLRDRVRPLLIAAAGWAWGEDFVATHMAWGAVNEWTTQAGYSLLARKAAHPVLSEVLGRIMRQEGRHITFYATQAHRRLAASRRARRLARLALERFWQPVGSGLMPAAESDFLLSYLLADDAGRQAVARIDRRVDSLPGLGGLALVARAAVVPVA